MDIDPDKKVAELIDLHPQVLPTLVAAGFTPLRIPGVRAMMAHTITLRQACEKRGIPLDNVVQQLQQACAGSGEEHGGSHQQQ
jgi:Domain of unknown function (DUF1858)